MRNIIFLLLAFAAAFESRAQEQSIRFEDLKTLVENRNERVKSKSLEVQASEDRKGQLLRSFLPTAELYAGQEEFKKGPLSRRSQPTYGAEVQMNLFNGGRDHLENKKRKLVAHRKHFEKVNVISDELTLARETYWNVLYLRELNLLLEDLRKNNNESLKAAERRRKAGVGTETDRLEFEMYDIEIKRSLEEANLSYKNEIQKLAVILGFERDHKFSFPEPLIHEHNFEVVLKHNESDHDYLVKPAELRAEEAEMEARIQRRSWMPKLDAFAGYHQFNQREESEYTRASDRRESVVGLRLTLSLFDSIASRSEASALSAEAQSQALEASYAKKSLEAHLQSEKAELQLLHDQVHSAEENIKRAQKYYQLTQNEYSRGVKNSPDVVGATEKLHSMRQRRLEIVKDFQVAKSHILSKIGK